MLFLEPSARSPFKQKETGSRLSLLVCGQADAGALALRAAAATARQICSAAAPFTKVCLPHRLPPTLFNRLYFNKEPHLSVEVCSHSTAQGSALSARTRTSRRTAQARSKRLREQLWVCAASADEGECIILLQPDASSHTETLLILLAFITRHSEAFDKTMATGCLLRRQREYAKSELVYDSSK